MHSMRAAAVLLLRLSSHAFLLPGPVLHTTPTGLDTILQLSTPRYNNSQGDLVSSCANRAKSLGSKLNLMAARLARIQVRQLADVA